MRHYGHLAPWLVDGPPEVMVELGPGSSLGVGLAGLLAGVKQYVALDLQVHRDAERDRRVLAGLLKLFQDRAAFAERTENGQVFFPPAPNKSVWAKLADALPKALSPASVAEVERDLARLTDRVRFLAPWADKTILPPGSVDWLMTHSVMEHVDDLAGTYGSFARWLKPGGFATHLIDFQSHGLTRDWNGHWTLRRGTWTILRGRRPYLINRKWRSHHVSLMRENGIEVLAELHFTRSDGADRMAFREPFSEMPNGDDRIAMGFFVTRKVA